MAATLDRRASFLGGVHAGLAVGVLRAAVVDAGPRKANIPREKVFNMA